jgi:hypothetical protein
VWESIPEKIWLLRHLLLLLSQKITAALVLFFLRRGRRRVPILVVALVYRSALVLTCVGMLADEDDDAGQ